MAVAAVGMVVAAFTGVEAAVTMLAAAFTGVEAAVTMLAALFTRVVAAVIPAQAGIHTVVNPPKPRITPRAGKKK